MNTKINLINQNNECRTELLETKQKCMETTLNSEKVLKKRLHSFNKPAFLAAVGGTKNFGNLSNNYAVIHADTAIFVAVIYALWIVGVKPFIFIFFE